MVESQGVHVAAERGKAPAGRSRPAVTALILAPIIAVLLGGCGGGGGGGTSAASTATAPSAAAGQLSSATIAASVTRQIQAQEAVAAYEHRQASRLTGVMSCHAPGQVPGVNVSVPYLCAVSAVLIAAPDTHERGTYAVTPTTSQCWLAMAVASDAGGKFSPFYRTKAAFRSAAAENVATFEGCVG